ncbi:MAG TPA: Gfo/Idh/MocA family oxidoreductase [Saprospiraceae bacterium]|nr:Gfo/Idh/MocA family oxidoreductase [Saprospiraceae bacterium]
MQAIKDLGHELVAAMDPHDSVGILDRYFLETDFFTEIERFDRHLDKLRRQGKGIDYLVVCSPNYLHDAHIRFGLRLGADVVCEKPLVLNSWNLDALSEIEKETGRKIFTILQLRLHPQVIKLKKRIDAGSPDKIYEIQLDYLTTRGKWYDYSWKGDVSKSGGIATNIGIHFFDMLIWIFGDVVENKVGKISPNYASGELHLAQAKVNWRLSTDSHQLPEKVKAKGGKTYRALMIDGEEFEFSGGFTDLHTRSYADILEGGGFGIDETGKAVALVGKIRNG